MRKARRVRKDGEGECIACGHQFDYCLIHNGFNESAYAYCDSCGITALLDGWRMPRDVRIPLYGVIPAKHEALLAACSCGGQYRYGAAPRCPHCHAPLDAVAVTSWIEANAPGARSGWRWQQTWVGLYAIVIEGRIAENTWRSGSSDGKESLG